MNSVSLPLWLGHRTTLRIGISLASMVPDLPTLPEDNQRLMVVGTLADIIEEQFRRHFAQLGISEVDFFPAARADDLPPVGPGTRVLLAQPYLSDTVSALCKRGAELVSAPYPRC